MFIQVCLRALATRIVPLAFLVTGAGIGMAAAQAFDLPEAPGRELVVDVCSGCHALQRVMAQHRTPEGWADVMDEMLLNGARMTPEEQATVLTYLNTNLGTTGAPSISPTQ